jgi:hypothetical protein
MARGWVPVMVFVARLGRRIGDHDAGEQHGRDQAETGHALISHAWAPAAGGTASSSAAATTNRRARRRRPEFGFTRVGWIEISAEARRGRLPLGFCDVAKSLI